MLNIQGWNHFPDEHTNQFLSVSSAWRFIQSKNRSIYKNKKRVNLSERTSCQDFASVVLYSTLNLEQKDISCFKLTEAVLWGTKRPFVFTSCFISNNISILCLLLSSLVSSLTCLGFVFYKFFWQRLKVLTLFCNLFC